MHKICSFVRVVVKYSLFISPLINIRGYTRLEFSSKPIADDKQLDNI